jgi:hypothetical protein
MMEDMSDQEKKHYLKHKTVKQTEENKAERKQDAGKVQMEKDQKAMQKAFEKKQAEI